MTELYTTRLGKNMNMRILHNRIFQIHFPLAKAERINLHYLTIKNEVDGP